MIGFSREDAWDTWAGVGTDNMPKDDWQEYIELSLTCKYVDVPQSQFISRLNEVLNEARGVSPRSYTN